MVIFIVDFLLLALRTQTYTIRFVLTVLYALRTVLSARIVHVDFVDVESLLRSDSNSVEHYYGHSVF